MLSLGLISYISTDVQFLLTELWIPHLAALNEVIVHKIVIIGLEGSPKFVLVIITVTP
jgi:hypothetical protein